MSFILGDSPYSKNTRDFCLDDMAAALRNQPEADGMLMEITTAINKALKELPPRTIDVQIVWMNIPNRRHNPDGRIGFFRVDGKPPAALQPCPTAPTPNCDFCHGLGEVMAIGHGDEECPRCGGTGKQFSTQKCYQCGKPIDQIGNICDNCAIENLN